MNEPHRSVIDSRRVIVYPLLAMAIGAHCCGITESEVIRALSRRRTH